MRIVTINFLESFYNRISIVKRQLPFENQLVGVFSHFSLL